MTPLLLADLLLCLLALPLLCCCGYLLVFALCAFRTAPPPGAPAPLRFDVIVPAHDEEAGIARTVAGLLAMDWPRQDFRVRVVADNCSDATAERARSAGAEVLVRENREQRGKGYALEHAFERSLADGFAGALVVVDADTQVSPNLLRAFAARLHAGERAVQADYAVANPEASWRTRLLAVALGMFHVERSRARERLGVSCGLRGNGMCFSVEALRRVPHQAFSLVEDVEYGARLAQAGIRVAYADEAHVYGEMVSRGAAASTQRDRWERGRRKLRALGLSLLRGAFVKRSGMLFDVAMDLLMPPLSRIVALCLLGGAASLAVSLLAHRPAASLVAWLVCLGCVLCYVVRGWAASGTGARGLGALAFAPVYLAWKATLLLRRGGGSEWIRTTREGQPPPP